MAGSYLAGLSRLGEPTGLTPDGYKLLRRIVGLYLQKAGAVEF